MTTRTALLGAALTGTALLSACSSTAHSTPTQLQRDVSALSTAAAAHDIPAARAAINTLNSDLRAARSAGTISQARYDQIVANISAVSHDLATPESTSSASRTTTSVAVHTTTPTTKHPPPARATPTKTPDKSKTHGHGKGGGNGNG